MPRFYNIRWTDSDEKELKKAVKNFNAKISRLEKKFANSKDPAIRRQKNALPERVSVRELKELIKTRKDLNREINMLQRFSRKGAEELVDLPIENEYNIKVTKWQRREMLRRASTINQIREKRRNEIAEIEMTSGGKTLGYKRGELGMGSLDDNKMRPINAFTYSDTRDSINRKLRTLIKESQSVYWDARDYLMRENYKQGLMNEFYSHDPERTKAIIDKIDKMEFKEFYKVFQAEGGKFDYYYKGDKERETYLSREESKWLPAKRKK